MEEDFEKRYLVAQSLRFKVKRFIFRTRPKKVYFAIFVLFGVAVVSFGYILVSTNKVPEPSNILGTSVGSLLGNSELTDEQVIEKVAKLTVLPEGETPEVATIADANQLKDQVFFQQAENGDKVLIYRGAKRVIMYRPSVNKIIETGHQIEPTPTPMPVEEEAQIQITPEESNIFTPTPTPTTSLTISPTETPEE